MSEIKLELKKKVNYNLLDHSQLSNKRTGWNKRAGGKFLARVSKSF